MAAIETQQIIGKKYVVVIFFFDFKCSSSLSYTLVGIVSGWTSDRWIKFGMNDLLSIGQGFLMFVFIPIL